MGKKELRFTGEDAWMGSYAGKGEEAQLHKDLQKRYGIKAPRVLKMDNDGAVEAHNYRKSYAARVSRAVNNDYDTRRTLEAKALSGDKDAREFAEKGIKGIQGAYDVNQMFRKDHERRGNNPDEFGSQSDYSQMTMAAVDKDRKSNNAKFATKGDLDALKKAQEEKKAPEPTVKKEPTPMPEMPKPVDMTFLDAPTEAQLDLSKYDWHPEGRAAAKEKAQLVIDKPMSGKVDYSFQGGSYGDAQPEGTDSYGNATPDKVKEEHANSLLNKYKSGIIGANQQT